MTTALFAHLERSSQLGRADLAAAAAEREVCAQLLARLVEISKPGDAAPPLLLLFARLATSACTWIDGGLRFELVASGDQTVVETMTELGAGFRERLFPSFSMRVPLDAFEQTIARAPRVVAPLVMKRSKKSLVLTVSEAIRRTTLPPPNLEIDQSALFDVTPNPPPKAVEGD